MISASSVGQVVCCSDSGGHSGGPGSNHGADYLNSEFHPFGVGERVEISLQSMTAAEDYEGYCRYCDHVRWRYCRYCDHVRCTSHVSNVKSYAEPTRSRLMEARDKCLPNDLEPLTWASFGAKPGRTKSKDWQLCATISVCQDSINIFHKMCKTKLTSN